MAQRPEITTPRGRVFTVRTRNGNVTARLEWAHDFGSQRSRNFSQAQKFVDSECLRYMDPLTPRRTGMMIKSGTLGTVIGSGEIEYLAPYARRQYYENRGGNGQRGKKWFERMKAAHKSPIIRGAQRIAAGG